MTAPQRYDDHRPPSGRTAMDAVQLRTVQEAGPYIRRNDIGVGTVVPDGPLPFDDHRPPSDRTVLDAVTFVGQS